MSRRIGIAGTVLVLLCGVWLFFSAEDAVPRDEMVALPCELKWSVADVSVSKNTDIKSKIKAFVPIVGQLKGPKGWLWSPLSNVATGREYPDGIRAPEALPDAERQMLLRNIRSGKINTLTMSDQAHVVRMFARCVPDLPSTPSARAKLETVGLSVAMGVKSDTAFFAGLMEMPEEPGIYWIQLWCEFTTQETFNAFVPFAGGPVAEVAVNVTP